MYVNASYANQQQEAGAREQFFQHAFEDTRAAAKRMAATDRVRYETMITAAVPGVFARLLEELVFCSFAS